MRLTISAFMMFGLAACAPEIPDSGVGFDNSADAQRARELALTGQPTSIVPPAVISPESAPSGAPFEVQPAQRTPGSSNTASSADIAAEAAAALEASSRNSGVAPVQASPANAAPASLNNPGISDENDFGAVSDRQSIASDAARIERNRQQYQVIAPTAVPSRPANSGPNIVSYALSTQHPRGTRLHSRSGLNLAARAQRACANYPSADQAQIDFLAKGGPERDRLGVDPDGDGYACTWNPAPFRSAVNN
ncbi:MAG: hypothetical protein AB8B51_14065 [Sedimentitalea sp.]